MDAAKTIVAAADERDTVSDGRDLAATKRKNDLDRAAMLDPTSTYGADWPERRNANLNRVHAQDDRTASNHDRNALTKGDVEHDTDWDVTPGVHASLRRPGGGALSVTTGVMVVVQWAANWARARAEHPTAVLGGLVSPVTERSGVVQPGEPVNGGLKVHLSYGGCGGLGPAGGAMLTVGHEAGLLARTGGRTSQPPPGTLPLHSTPASPTSLAATPKRTLP